MHSAMGQVVSTRHDVVIRELITALKRIEGWGLRPGEIFAHWIGHVEAAVSALPGWLATLGPVRDSDLTRERLTPYLAPLIKRRAPADASVYLDHYVAATAILLNAAYTQPIFDYLGALYSLYAAPANPSRSPGEFYTPIDVARLQAQLVAPPYLAMLSERLQAATVAAVHAQSDLAMKILGQGLAGLTAGDPAETSRIFLTRILPLIAPYVEPIKIYDPCCGSGGLLLAMAAHFPSWANRAGIVHYYGQDLNEQAVQLARLNCRLFGLNGTQQVVTDQAESRSKLKSQLHHHKTQIATLQMALDQADGEVTRRAQTQAALDLLQARLAVLQTRLVEPGAEGIDRP